MSRLPVCRRAALVAACFTLGALLTQPRAVRAQDTVPTDLKSAYGHSMLGNAFNDIPRQRAYLMKGMPNVHFPITTKQKDAQRFFDQGIGQLHGFWYLEASRSFRKVVELDPACPMGYWGLAMAGMGNDPRGKAFMAKAVENKAHASERECLWIDSLAAYFNADAKMKDRERARTNTLVKAWQDIVKYYPEDVEAKAFLALLLLENPAVTPKHPKEEIDKLMKQVLAANPMHPIHHYRIHLWDSEATEKNALDSAALCGPSSPGIAHLWHMQGHTYTGLRRYADAAYSQEASARVDHAYMIRDHVLPDEIHNYAHNNQWLVENLEYLGRVHEALDLARNMVELPRHPRFNTLNGGSAEQGHIRLLETLFCYDLWNEALALDKQGVLEPTDIPNRQAERLTLLSEAAFATGDLPGGRKYLAELLALQAAHQPKMDKDGKAVRAEQDTYAFDPAQVVSRVAEARACEALAVGNREEAGKQLDLAKNTPPARAARLRLRAGQPGKAEELARQAVQQSAQQVAPLATLVDALAQNGKHDEALKRFADLRTLAANADLDVELLAKLAPLAREAGCVSSDWRTPAPAPADIGPRPSLTTLGPFRWSPTPAAGFTLHDTSGAKVSLAEYTKQGKPVLLLFYLGSACRQCVEQLNAFAPLRAEFEKAGISLIAISTDSPENMKKFAQQPEPHTPLDFPLLSDKDCKVFKAYRAYDDFEGMALHGAFLIDGKGLTRWQDIRFEPFTNARFVLDEAKRLFALGKNRE